MHLENLFALAGQTTVNSLNDLLVLDLDTRIWTNITGPSSGTYFLPRSNHGFVQAEERLYVHGGRGMYGESPFPFFSKSYVFCRWTAADSVVSVFLANSSVL